MIKSVKKRNGRIEPFSVEKINACAERACEGLSISPSDLVLSAQLELFEKIPTSEIERSDSSRKRQDVSRRRVV